MIRLSQLTNGLNIIENAGCRFAVNHCNMRNFRVLLQCFLCFHSIRYFIIILCNMNAANVMIATHCGDSFPIGPIAEQQQTAIVRNHAGNHTFHPEGSGALHQYSCICSLIDMCQLQQLSSDSLRNLLIILIPCTVIKQHFLLYTVCCRKWSRC